MIDDENPHLFTNGSDGEIVRVSREQVGVFLLWQGARCVHVDEGVLRARLLTANAQFPLATHFSLVMNSHGNDRFQIVEKLRILYGLTQQTKPPIGFQTVK